MTSYRVKRRAFLAGIGGAFGLEAMLGNLEAGAAGMSSPPRLLVVYWPVGTIRHHFVPTGSGTTYTTSRILQPFETAGLRQDLVVLYGLTHTGLDSGLGGSDEYGTVASVTGVSSPGTRANGGEADDSVAGGPSWDQIFLKNVPALARRDETGAIRGRGYYNTICDKRVDSNETSTACLSYGYSRQAIQSARPGGTITENLPLQPMMSPLTAFNDLFSGFMPGGGSTPEMVRGLRMRKSVLDSALRDLARLHTLAPVSQRSKIDIHTDAVRQLERQLADQIDNGTMSCTVPTPPDASITGKSGSRLDYGNPQATVRDDPMLEQTGKAHLAIIRAAFQCDLIRTATFQWCPGTNHVSFGGLYPDNPSGYYMHHPMSHRTGVASFFTGPPPTTDLSLYEFLTNVHTWYNQKLADVLAEWKTAVDGLGGNLLDHTIVPTITNVAHGAHARSPLPALILGGRALGVQGGQYQNFESAPRPHNDLWLSVAQALMPGAANVMDVLGAETFAANTASFTGPIAGLWSRP